MGKRTVAGRNDQSASNKVRSIANLRPEEARSAVAEAVQASPTEEARNIVSEMVQTLPDDAVQTKKEIVQQVLQTLPDDATDAKKEIVIQALQAWPVDAVQAKEDIVILALQTLPDDATDAKKEIVIQALQAWPVDAVQTKKEIVQRALQTLPDDATDAKKDIVILALQTLPDDAVDDKDDLRHQLRSDAPVPTLQDRPAYADELGRRPFARMLADRIRRMREENVKSSFVLHIYGPWGSGKSSLLNFLRSELEKEADSPTEEGHSASALTRSPWIIIDFNAWQRQRIGPPWWWLLDSVFQQGVRQLWTIQWRDSKTFSQEWWRALMLTLRDRFRAVQLIVEESIWRFLKAGRARYLLALLTLTLLFGLTWLLGASDLLAGGQEQAPSGSGTATIQDFLSNLQQISGILTLITGSWAAILGFGRSLLPASAQAAENFMETAHDPMDALSQHFKVLVDRLAYPVVILVDDLDRCQDTYVIDLLEGIQTMFRDAPVTYVVAADRRWICTSYERRYEGFTDQVTEPGRPLGHLFLEKTFQLSVSVPYMSFVDQADYWRRLLEFDRSMEEKERVGELEKARDQARQELGGLRTAEQIRTAVRDSPDDPLRQQALRAEAAVRLGRSEVEAHTEHFLQPFARLLEPNPRSMKRLVNAFGVRRDADVLRGGNIDTRQLALFTILDLRWPLLAEYLGEHPERVEYIGKQVIPKDIPDNLQALFKDQEVQEVIEAERVEGVETSLDPDAIRACMGLALHTPNHS
jgi:hypothetical protein